MTLPLCLNSHIGFEDGLTLPDDTRPTGKLELYQAALKLMETK